MRSNENRAVIACAGSGKTTLLVNEAIASRDRRIAIVTYTNNNLKEIVKRFDELNSGVPGFVEAMTWFGFLLRQCARPYQRSKYEGRRIESIMFVNTQSAKYVRETDIRRYYFAKDELIFSDKIARFVVECEKASNQSVTARLRQIYTDIFVDEFQDLAGWDLEFIQMLLQSGIRITLVGDPRQHIYSTSPAQKNKQYSGVNVIRLLEKWNRSGLCQIEPQLSRSYRCNQAVCDFANGLWPGMEAMQSLVGESGEHAGVFLVTKDAVDEYVGKFAPQILRHNKNSEAFGGEVLNFGVAKGLQFKHVLIVPTVPIRKFLETGDLKHLKGGRDKLHVAVTRAQQSVAFVFDGSSPIVHTRYL
jgi:DNA helicase II / ATP-dependent DNA helicase PcrA